MLGKGAGMDDAAIRDARLGKSADKKTNAAVSLARQLVASLAAFRMPMRLPPGPPGSTMAISPRSSPTWH